MPPTASANPLRDPELVDFILGGVSAAVATRDRARTPHLARLVGCACEGDRLVLYVPHQQAVDVLADIADNGAVAAVFTRPQDHRTVQLKGGPATVVPVDAAARERVAAYCRAFADSLGSLGFAREYTVALLEGAAHELVGIAFEPREAYTGTPGPRAGSRIGPPR